VRVVTSYNPQVQDITLEDTGANTETDRQFIYNTYSALLKTLKRCLANPKQRPTKTTPRIVQGTAGQHEAAGGRGQAAHRL